MTDSNQEIDVFGTKVWRNSYNQFHRFNGPAVILTDGSKFWYINNKRNRIDGPACVHRDGDKSWWKNNKFIREFIYD